VIAIAAPPRTGETHTNRPDRRSSPLVIAVVAGISAATVLGLFGLIGLVTWSVLHRAPETTANPPLVAALSPSPNTEEKPVAERKGPDNLSTEAAYGRRAVTVHTKWRV
jgi:hypothetical protein